MTSVLRRLALPATTILALTLCAAPARAQDKAACGLIEISATNAKAPSIPADLKPLAKKLRKPPLSSWNSFKVLTSAHMTLETLKADQARLKMGKASVILREVDRRSGKRPRLTLGVTMDDRAGKRVVDSKVVVDSGDYLVVGETLANNDGHFVALSCTL
jgi:hypothetical protein